MRISDGSSDVCSSDLVTGTGPQELLDAADGVSVLVEQTVDTLRQSDIVGTVIAPVSRALERAELGEAGFPIAQDMPRDAEVARQVAHGAEGAFAVAGQIESVSWRERVCQ